MKKSLRNIGISLSVVFALWLLIDLVFQPKPYLIPSPLQVLGAFSSYWDLILRHGLITIVEVMIGFIIANLISLILAALIVTFPKVESSTIAMAVTLKTIPVIAIAPLLVLWFGAGIWSKIAAVVTVCFLPSLINIATGAHHLDTKIRDLAKLYGATRLQILRFFILPGLKPAIFSALKASSTLAVVGALVGELVSANEGIGFLIISSYYSLNISLVFACIIFTSIFGVIFYYTVDYFDKR